MFDIGVTFGAYSLQTARHRFVCQARRLLRGYQCEAERDSRSGVAGNSFRARSLRQESGAARNAIQRP
jgi:hypothetical protein